MIHTLVTRVRALLRGRNWIPEGADVCDEDWGAPLPHGPVSLAESSKPRWGRELDLAEPCEPDPEWEELLAWALVERAPAPRQVAVRPVEAAPRPPARMPVQENEDEEWEWVIARAKAEARAKSGPRSVAAGRRPPLGLRLAAARSR